MPGPLVRSAFASGDGILHLKSWLTTPLTGWQAFVQRVSAEHLANKDWTKNFSGGRRLISEPAYEAGGHPLGSADSFLVGTRGTAGASRASWLQRVSVIFAASTVAERRVAPSVPFGD
jgi:hypothetical protein